MDNPVLVENLNSCYQSLPEYMKSLTMDTASSATIQIETAAQAATAAVVPSTSEQMMNIESSLVASTSFHHHSTMMIMNNCDGNEENQGSLSQHKFTRRLLPSRKTKDRFLHECKRRVIQKPKKVKNELNLNEIKKLYLQKNYMKFKTSNLETIYEEPFETYKGEIRFIGGKKLKRSISFSDGLNITKSTVKSRRDRIKKLFGRRNPHQKITLDDLLIKLNRNIEDETDDDNDNENESTAEEIQVFDTSIAVENEGMKE